MRAFRPLIGVLGTRGLQARATLRLRSPALASYSGRHILADAHPHLVAAGLAILVAEQKAAGFANLAGDGQA
jgi:hypothetical protein